MTIDHPFPDASEDPRRPADAGGDKRPGDTPSPLTLHRLSVVLRSLRRLEREGVERISSQELARRFHLSAAQIRKDLAHFGELGIRGVGYDVRLLRERLETRLGLDRTHRAVIVGVGNLGSALARFPGFTTGAFRVVALVDNDPAKTGRRVNDLRVEATGDLPRVVGESGAEIGILTVPAEAAQDNYDALVAAGIQAVLNFAPVQLEEHPDVPTRTVDFLIFLEEIAFLLR